MLSGNANVPTRSDSGVITSRRCVEPNTTTWTGCKYIDSWKLKRRRVQQCNRKCACKMSIQFNSIILLLGVEMHTRVVRTREPRHPKSCAQSHFNRWRSASQFSIVSSFGHRSILENINNNLYRQIGWQAMPRYPNVCGGAPSKEYNDDRLRTQIIKQTSKPINIVCYN